MTSTYEYGPLSFKPAGAEDDADLKALCRDNPMDSWVRVCVERETSFFAAERLWPESLPVIVRDRSQGDRAAGMWHAGVLPSFVNGQAARCGYLGGLRIGAAYRNKPRFLRAGFQSIRALGPDRIGAADTWFTSVADGNAAAKRLLEAGIRGLPRYRPAASLHTLAIAARQGARQGLLRRATPGDLPGLLEFYNRQSASYQFSPLLSEAWLADMSGMLAIEDFLVLAEDNAIRGCLALWDQRAFKQTIVQGYRFPLRHLRRPWNWLAYLRRTIPLPAAGHQLHSAFIAFFALDPSYEELAPAVIRDALSFLNPNLVAGLVGMATDNALRESIAENLRPQVYGTTIYTLEWPDSTAPALDGRPVQPEIAML